MTTREYDCYDGITRRVDILEVTEEDVSQARRGLLGLTIALYHPEDGIQVASHQQDWANCDIHKGLADSLEPGRTIVLRGRLAIIIPPKYLEDLIEHLRVENSKHTYNGSTYDVLLFTGTNLDDVAAFLDHNINREIMIHYGVLVRVKDHAFTLEPIPPGYYLVKDLMHLRAISPEDFRKHFE